MRRPICVRVANRPASRLRRNLDRRDMKLLFNINAEFAHTLDQRPIELRAKYAVFSSMADAMLVSGPITGQPADTSDLRKDSETVTDVLEPTLVRLGFVTIGAGGRRLTDKGRDHIESLISAGDDS